MRKILAALDSDDAPSMQSLLRMQHRILGGTRRRYATLGDVVIVAVGLLVLNRTNRTGKSTDPFKAISKVDPKKAATPSSPAETKRPADKAAVVTPSLAAVQATRQASSARDRNKNNKNDRMAVTPNTLSMRV